MTEIDPSTFVSPLSVTYPDSFKIGKNSWIAAQAIVRGDIIIGDNCSINSYSCISGKVTIGSSTRIASLVTIVGFNHGFDDLDKPIHKQPCTTKGIIIGDDVWIGANVVIIDGITVASHSIIAAGSIVTRDIPEYSIVAGNPARVLRDRRQPKKVPTGKKGLSSGLESFSTKAASEWKSVLKNSIKGKAGKKYYQCNKAAGPTIRAWCDAIEIAAMFDSTPDLETPAQLIKRLQKEQIADGSWGPPVKNDGTHGINSYHYLCVGYALENLGAHLKYPVKNLNKLLGPGFNKAASNLNWAENSWGGGAWFDIVGTAAYHHLKYHTGGSKNKKNTGTDPDLSAVDMEKIFGWLTIHIDKSTGLWGTATKKQGWLQPVNGFYRLTRGTYAQFGIPLPYPETSIDTILTHCRQNKNFINENITACNVLDIVHPLWLCSRQTDHRKNEIILIMEQQVEEIIKRWEPEKGFAFSPSESPGLQGTEMWLSVIYIACTCLGIENGLSFKPKGVHRTETGLQL